MIVLVGLGNPDKIYEKTYHNIGFMAIDFFANKHNISFSKSKYNAKVAEGLVNGKKVVLIKPQTYMNLSGNSVLQIVNQLKLPLNNLCVIYDDIDLDNFKIRYRTNGSAGTHNGMRDIVAKLNSTEFSRIRIGIGRPQFGNLADYVLSHIPQDKLDKFNETFEDVSKLLEEFIDNDGKVLAKSI